MGADPEALGVNSESSAHYPVFVDLRGKQCVVVGAGRVGERKIRGLLEGGADIVRVVALQATPQVASWAEEGAVEWSPRPYEAADLDGATLAFAATANVDVNQQVVEDARRLGVLVNAADRHTRGDFIGASTIRRGDIQIAISSGGGSPAYVRMLRQHLEQALGPEHEAFASYLKELRPRVHARFPEDITKRESVWRNLVSEDVLELVRQNEWDHIDELVSRCLS